MDLDIVYSAIFFFGFINAFGRGRSEDVGGGMVDNRILDEDAGDWMSVWQSVRQRAEEFRKKYAARIQERRIERILGKTVQRPVVTVHNTIVIPAGAVITSESILRAEEYGVLDQLLYTVREQEKNKKDNEHFFRGNMDTVSSQA